MTPTAASPLSPGERAVLAAFADVIAPRWNSLPSAGDIDLSAGPVDRALRARPDLVQPLKRLLGELDVSRPSAEMAALQRDRPAEFQVLMQAVAGAYYMDDSVRAALGYSGQRRLPIGEPR